MTSPWRTAGRTRQMFDSIAGEIGELGEQAAGDAKVLTDLRALRRHLADVIKLAEADSPVVAERKRRGRISYLESELARLREVTTSP